MGNRKYMVEVAESLPWHNVKYQKEKGIQAFMFQHASWGPANSTYGKHVLSMILPKCTVSTSSERSDPWTLHTYTAFAYIT